MCIDMCIILCHVCGSWTTLYTWWFCYFSCWAQSILTPRALCYQGNWTLCFT